MAWGWPQALLQLVLSGDEVGRESSAPGQYEGTRPALKGRWQGRLGILGLPARDGVPLRPWSRERGSEAGLRSLVLPPGGDGWDDRKPRARRIFISHSRVSELRCTSVPILRYGDHRPQNPQRRRQSPTPSQDV